MATTSAHSGDHSSFSALPIDIHADKLLNWLIGRRHCTKNWHEKYLKAVAALKDLLSRQKKDWAFSSFIKGEFDIFALRRATSELENQGRNETQELQEMDEVLTKATERLEAENIGLAHAAFKFSKLMCYDLPSAKKTLNELKKQVSSSEKAIQGYENSMKNILIELQSKCRKLGIPPCDINHVHEIGSIRQAEEIFGEILPDFERLAEPLTYHANYMNTVFKGELEFNLYLLADIIQYVSNKEVVSEYILAKAFSHEEYKSIMRSIWSKGCRIVLETAFRQALTTELIQLLNFFRAHRIAFDSHETFKILSEFGFEIENESVVEDWTKKIEGLLAKIQSEKLDISILVQVSTSYRQRLESELNSFKMRYLHSAAEREKNKRLHSDALLRYGTNQELFDDLVASANELSKNLKKTISQLYNGRRINFLSESNSYLN